MIGSCAFEYAGISELTIPESITNIGRWAFYACQSLEVFNFNAINCTSDGYVHDNLVSIIFDECTSLHTLNIGTEVQTIPLGAFWHTNLTGSLVIPNSVTSIEGQAFQECSGLTSISISQSVTHIGRYAFAACTALANVTIGWSTPLSVSASVFSNVDVASVTLRVPAGTKALYEAADVWKDFGTIKEMTVTVEAPDPVTQDGKGSIELSLSIPSNATLIGSFEIKFPESMILDEELTALVPELAGNFTLSFTFIGNNTWLIEIKANGLKSSTAVEYRKIMDIAYKANESVSKGEYEATITNLDFTLDDDTSIKEDELPVIITVPNNIITSINSAHTFTFNVSVVNDMLRIESSEKELITIYSVMGTKLYSAMKESGRIEIPISLLSGSVFIVKGSASGSLKVINK